MYYIEYKKNETWHIQGKAEEEARAREIFDLSQWIVTEEECPLRLIEVSDEYIQILCSSDV